MLMKDIYILRYTLKINYTAKNRKMNLIEVTEDLMNGVKFVFSTFFEVLKLLNPANIDSVFKNMKIGTPGMLRFYLFVTTIPLFLGYYFYLSMFQNINLYSQDDSIKVAFRYYVVSILLPITMAYALYLFDTRLLKRKVSYAEALTLFTYALSPGILGGVFRIIGETFVLHILLIMYTIYLIFAGMSARYGEERITLPFLFLILFGMICAITVFVILTALLGISPGKY
jgi:hypothetical protein